MTVDTKVDSVILTVDGLATATSYTLSSPAGSLVLGGVVPTVTGGVTVVNTTIIPSAGSVSVGGVAPTVAVSVSGTVIPNGGTLSIGGANPTIVGSVSYTLIPASCTLSLVQQFPAVTITTNFTGSVVVVSNSGLIILKNVGPDVLISGATSDYPKTSPAYQAYGTTGNDDENTVVLKAVSGVPNLKTYYSTTWTTFTVIHEMSDAGKMILFQHYLVYRKSTFRFLYTQDGNYYNCRYAGPPSIVPLDGGTWWNITNTLIRVS